MLKIRSASPMKHTLTQGFHLSIQQEGQLVFTGRKTLSTKLLYKENYPLDHWSNQACQTPVLNQFFEQQEIKTTLYTHI